MFGATVPWRDRRTAAASWRVISSIYAIRDRRRDLGRRLWKCVMDGGVCSNLVTAVFVEQHEADCGDDDDTEQDGNVQQRLRQLPAPRHLAAGAVFVRRQQSTATPAKLSTPPVQLLTSYTPGSLIRISPNLCTINRHDWPINLLRSKLQYSNQFQNDRATSECGRFRRLRKPQKLIGYHSNGSWATAKLMSVYSHVYQCWKFDEDQSSSFWDIWWDMPIFAVSSKSFRVSTFVNFRVRTDLDQVRTEWSSEYCHLIFSNRIAIFQFVLKCQCAEWKLVHQFCPKIGYHGNDPWGIKKEVQIDHLWTNTHHLLKKIVKIGPVDPEIIWLRAIIKKKKKITAGKIYIPVWQS